MATATLASGSTSSCISVAGISPITYSANLCTRSSSTPATITEPVFPHQKGHQRESEMASDEWPDVGTGTVAGDDTDLVRETDGSLYQSGSQTKAISTQLSAQSYQVGWCQSHRCTARHVDPAAAREYTVLQAARRQDQEDENQMVLDTRQAVPSGGNDCPSGSDRQTMGPIIPSMESGFRNSHVRSSDLHAGSRIMEESENGGTNPVNDQTVSTNVHVNQQVSGHISARPRLPVGGQASAVVQPAVALLPPFVPPSNYYAPPQLQGRFAPQLPIAPVSQCRLSWTNLMAWARSAQGADYQQELHLLETMYRMLFVPVIINDVLAQAPLPRRYPKYNNFKRYPRARHRELLNTGLLISCSLVTSTAIRLFCVHPWNLVPKSNGIQSRIVVDTSILTKYPYPRGLPVPIMKQFMAYQSDPQMDAHVEWDLVSYFYQIPIGTHLWDLFTIQAYRHSHALSRLEYFCWQVLPQGWRPSSEVAQSISEWLCIMLITMMQPIVIKAKPWVDNIIVRCRTADIPAVKEAMRQVLAITQLEAKPACINQPFLNVKPNWPDNTFTVCAEWVDKAKKCIRVRLNRQWLTLRKTWQAFGMSTYYCYTCSISLGYLQFTYKFMSAICQQYHDVADIDWDFKLQINDNVKSELQHVLSKLQTNLPVQIWTQPTVHLQQHHILIVDSSHIGYGWHYLMPDQNIKVKAARPWQPHDGHFYVINQRGQAQWDQFSAEVKGVANAIVDVQSQPEASHWNDDTKLLVITDVQSMAKAFNRSYSHHTDLMQLIMDVYLMNNMLVTWGQGGHNMPADPESRSRHSYTVRCNISDTDYRYVQEALHYGESQGFFKVV